MELRIKYSLYALVAGDVIFIWIACHKVPYVGASWFRNAGEEKLALSWPKSAGCSRLLVGQPDPKAAFATVSSDVL